MLTFNPVPYALLIPVGYALLINFSDAEFMQ